MLKRMKTAMESGDTVDVGGWGLEQFRSHAHQIFEQLTAQTSGPNDQHFARLLYEAQDLEHNNRAPDDSTPTYSDTHTGPFP